MNSYAGCFFRNKDGDEYIAIEGDNGNANMLPTVKVDTVNRTIGETMTYVKRLEEGRNKDYTEVSLEEFTEVYNTIRHSIEQGLDKVIKAMEQANSELNKPINKAVERE